MSKTSNNKSLDDIMSRVTAPELLDLIRAILDEIEGRLIQMIADTE
jgi:hypothetical protein